MRNHRTKIDAEYVQRLKSLSQQWYLSPKTPQQLLLSLRIVMLFIKNEQHLLFSELSSCGAKLYSLCHLFLERM